MASAVLTFNEVIDQAASDKLANEAKKSFSTRSPNARPKAVDDNYVMRSDRELSKFVSQAIATLQDAMDEASRAGLIIEPTFRSVPDRFNEFGVSVESYICSVEMYRKLS